MGPRPPAPPGPKLPDHPAYQQIMAVFAAADGRLRARQVCEAMDVEIAPNNINNTRLKTNRLTERGILVETEQCLFTQPRAVASRRDRGQPARPPSTSLASVICQCRPMGRRTAFRSRPHRFFALERSFGRAMTLAALARRCNSP
jgi:hypothetical protein